MDINSQENQENGGAALGINPCIWTIETEFNPVAGIYLEFVTKLAVRESSGIGIVHGPIAKHRYDAIKAALNADPNLPEQLGVTHIRVDDVDMSLRAIVATKYHKTRYCQLHTAAPIAVMAMMTAADDAKRINVNVAVLAGIDEKVRAQIEEILKYEKDVDIVFGVIYFAFQDGIECLPNASIEDGLLKRAAVKAHSSGDGWAAVEVSPELLARIKAANVDDEEVAKKFGVAGFKLDEVSGQLNAVVLKTATEEEVLAAAEQEIRAAAE